MNVWHLWPEAKGNHAGRARTPPGHRLMLHVLTHNILPVFAMLALGFVMGRGGTATATEARALNRIAFLVLQPPLIFLLMIGLDLQAFDPFALGAMPPVR